METHKGAGRAPVAREPDWPPPRKVFSPCETRRAQQDERDKRDEHAARKQHTRREEQGNEEHEHEELRQRDTDKKQAAPARMAATMTGKLRARRASSRPICTHEKPSGGRVSSGGDAPATVSLSRDRRAGGGWERAPSLVRRRGWRVGRTEGADRSPVAKAPLEARPGLSIAGETSPTHKRKSWVTDGRRITVGQSLEPLKRSPGYGFMMPFRFCC